MKKIFTLIAATVLTVATFAAGRKPVVSLKTSRNYEVVIDGRSYYSNNASIDLTNIRKGQHSIKVYEMNRGFGLGSILFKRAKKLVDASTFVVKNKDIDIAIDFRGQIRISEDRFGHDKWDDRRDNDHNRDRDWNRH